MHQKKIVCKSKYIPDKFHVKQAIIDETGIYPTDKDLNDSNFINCLINGLKYANSINGRKLKKLLKNNPNLFNTYLDKNYHGCSQKGMNSHYYVA